MMEVIWQPKALKQLKKIGDRAVQERILAATRELERFPACSNVRQLVNHSYAYRLRIGNWRVLFNAWEEVSIVSIEEVKKRDEHTY
jgi:mRNA-degrading endonuclease RelE of RelBE toxin-antitoxin system